MAKRVAMSELEPKSFSSKATALVQSHCCPRMRKESACHHWSIGSILQLFGQSQPFPSLRES